jgi:hypothetical protein
MVSHHFYYQLALLALVWLFVILYGLVNLLSVEALIRQEGVSTDRDRSFRLPPFP